MIGVPFSNTEFGAGPIDVFSSMGPGGLYMLHLHFKLTTAGTGSGSLGVELSWTDYAGQGRTSGAYEVVGTSTGEIVASLPFLTLQHPSTLKATFSKAGTIGGSPSGELVLFVSRVKEESDA